MGEIILDYLVGSLKGEENRRKGQSDVIRARRTRPTVTDIEGKTVE